ncbi:inosine-5'-monophosphate dehydrogenase [Striga asiatica]|uniref:Inosine-5'-monophosphate dehydrogenase n=1 Tax=Striga asiatica TaxID=4170 RepID=A0A5A7QPS8_STRAF|nr:inosine-5'-monophosphate dehydrogenase [Striga asiatica]
MYSDRADFEKLEDCPVINGHRDRIVEYQTKDSKKGMRREFLDSSSVEGKDWIGQLSGDQINEGMNLAAGSRKRPTRLLESGASFSTIGVAACEFDDSSSEEDRPSTSTSNPTRRTHTLPDLDLHLSPMEEESNYDLYNEHRTTLKNKSKSGRWDILREAGQGWWSCSAEDEARRGGSGVRLPGGVSLNSPGLDALAAGGSPKMKGELFSSRKNNGEERERSYKKYGNV